MADRLGNMTVGVSADLTGLQRNLDLATSKITAFAGAVRTRGQSIARDVFAVAGGTFAGSVARDTFGQVNSFMRDGVRDSVRLAASWERAGVAFEVLLGHADKARDLMRDLRGLAADSPLTLTDVTDEAKKLLAAGVDRGQVVPTLRMLSDLTMGDRTLMSRAALAYSQARSAGVLQGDELRQLNELGIPVMDAVAKAMGVEKSLVKTMVSEGQVRFQDLQRAFKDLTSEGGLFYRMTERGAETTEGQFARLRDSVEDLQRHLGRAIIEESGLNAAMQDGSRFADDMKRTVDDLRPSIRFTSDVVKGAAQVTGELVRNGPLFGRALGETLRDVSPRFARLVDTIDRGVQALKNFRADPRLVVDMAFDAGKAFGETFDALLGDLGGGLEAIHQRHIKPITDEIKSAADAWKALKGAVGAVNDPAEAFGREVRMGLAIMRGERPERGAFIRDRKAQYDDVFANARQTADRMADHGLGLLGLAGPTAVDSSDPIWKRRAKLQEDLLQSVTGVRDAAGRFHGRVYDATWAATKGERDRIAEELPKLERDLTDAAKRMDALLREAGGGGLIVNGQPAADAVGPIVARERAMDRLRNRLNSLVDTALARNADPQLARMMLLGGAGGFDPAKLNRPAEEFKIDPLSGLPAGGRGQAPFPSSMEWGSKAAAEAFAEMVNSRGEANPVVAAVERSTEVQREMRAELDQIRGHLAILATPTNRQRLIY